MTILTRTRPEVRRPSLEANSELTPEQAIQPEEDSYELHIQEPYDLPVVEPIQQPLIVDALNMACELQFDFQNNDNQFMVPSINYAENNAAYQPELYGQAQEEYPVGDPPMDGCGSFLHEALLPPAPMPVFESGEGGPRTCFVTNVPAVSYEPLFEHEDRPAYDHMPLQARPIPSDNRPYDLLELLGPAEDDDASSECDKENIPNTLAESLRSAALSFAADLYRRWEADDSYYLQHELEPEAASASGPRAAAEHVDNELSTPAEDEPKYEPCSPAHNEDNAADGEHDTLAVTQTNDSSEIDAPSVDSEDETNDTRYALADDSAQSALPSEDCESDSSSEDNVPLARFAGHSWQPKQSRAPERKASPAAPSKKFKKNCKSTPARQTRQPKRRGTMLLRSSKIT